jgi:predicted transcriptional regulator
MLTDFKWLTFESTLGEAADQLLAGSQQDFPIMEQGVVVAVLTRAVLIQGLAEFGRDARMRDVTTLEVRSVDADMPLVSAIVLLREHGMPCLQVLQNGKPVGLLTAENVTEYLMVKSALGEQHAPTIATTSPRVPPAIRS